MTNLHLTSRDEQIVRFVTDFRFITLDLLWPLVKQEPSPEKAVGKDGKTRPRRYGFGTTGLEKRLRKLCQEGFLKVLPARQPTERTFPFKMPPAVYGIGPKAADIVAPDDPDARAYLRELVRANQERNSLTLPHDLLRSTFHTCLLLACIKLEIELDWTQDRIELFDFDGKWHYPDAYFTLTKGNRTLHFALEVDMSTANVDPTRHQHTTIRKKMEVYLANRDKAFQLLWLTKPRTKEDDAYPVVREDSMMALYRSLAPSHNDFMLWLNGSEIPMEKPEQLVTENLFSCAYDADHGHCLFPHLNS